MKKINILFLIPVYILLVAITVFGYGYFTDSTFLSSLFNDKYDEKTEQIIKLAQDEVDAVFSQYKSEALPNATVELPGVQDHTGETELTGTVVFSGNKPDDLYPRVFGIDLSNESEIFQYLFDEFSDRPHLFAVSQRGFVSNDGDIFVSLYTEGVDVPGDPWLIHNVNRITSEEKPLLSTAGDLERKLDFNLDKGFLAFQRYVGVDDKYSTSLRLDSWETVVIDPQNDEKLLTLVGAGNPRWVNDTDSLIYFKADGMYVYNFNNKTEKKIYELDSGTINATSMMDVSSDGKYLIWSTAKKGTLSLFGIDKGDNGITLSLLEQRKDIETEYYWPTFSPDSSYYAVQAIGVHDDEAESRVNPRLEIFTLVTGEKVYTKSLADFDFNSLFIDDWVR